MEPVSETPTPTIVTETPAAPAFQSIAPLWHTIVLIVVLLAFSYASATAEHATGGKYGRIPQYVMTMGWEWLLFGYVAWGIRKSGVRVRDLIGGRWARVEEFLLDVAIAFGFWIVAMIVLSAIGYSMGLSGSATKLDEVKKQLGFLVPKTALELWLWAALSMTAGICEEFIFRGYLQRQFTALCSNAWAGIVIAGIFFGGGHGYEGVKRMLLIAIYGMMFGVLAHMRRSLRPGMLAHAMHDGFTGLMLRALLK